MGSRRFSVVLLVFVTVVTVVDVRRLWPLLVRLCKQREQILGYALRVAEGESHKSVLRRSSDLFSLLTYLQSRRSTRRRPSPSGRHRRRSNTRCCLN